MKVSKILESIGCPHLTLERAGGMYFLFVYWNPVADKFNCRKVNCSELKELPMSAWISIGRDFVNGVEASATSFFPKRKENRLTLFTNLV